MATLSDENPPAGTAEFFLGPMFSEKTTSVGRKIKRARLSCYCATEARQADRGAAAEPAARPARLFPVLRGRAI